MAYSIGFDIFAKDHASQVFERVGVKAGAMAGVTSALTTKLVNFASSASKSIVEFGIDSVKAYVDAEKQQRVLTDAYQRFPKLANVPLQSLRDQAQALQSVTKFDGDATAAAMGQLAAYKLTGTQLQQLTPLMLDYAQKTGKDLPTAAETLGKAILGQGRGLKDVGIKFKDTGTAAGNFKELMAGLRTQVGGFATQEGRSAEGQAAILGHKFEDLKESIGQQLLPVLVSLAGAGIKVLDWMNRNPAAAKALGVAFIALGVAIGVATVAWVAMNLAFIATPIGAIITGLVLLGIGLVVLWKKSETFRTIVGAAWDAIKIGALAMALGAVVAFRAIIVGMLTMAAQVVHGAAIAFGWVPGLGPKLKEADRKMTGFKDSVNTTLGRVQKTLEIQLKTAQATAAANALARKMAALRSKSIDIAVNYRVTAGRIWDGTKFVNVGLRAAGGPVKKGHPYIVGEKGPELIYPKGDGVVMNDQATAAALAGNVGRNVPGTASGAGQIIAVNLNIDGTRLEQVLLRLGRERGRFTIVPA